MPPIRTLVFALLLGLTTAGLGTGATAQGADRWTFDGERAGVCSANADACLHFVCEGGGLMLDSRADLWSRMPSVLNVTVPGLGGYTITRPDARSDQILTDMNDALGQQILSWVRAGNNFRVDGGVRAVVFTLRGSSAALSDLEARCSARPQSEPATAIAETGLPVDAFRGEFQRLANEATADASIGEMIEGEVKRFRNADLPGGDIRNGLSDPLLRGLTVDQCETLCLASPQCNAFTHNRDGDICFLKRDPTHIVPFAGATSGQPIGSWMPAMAPPTRGPGLVVDARASPRSSEKVEAFQARIRDLSAPLGRPCEVERRDLDAQLRGFAWTHGTTDDATVGAPFRLNWSGNGLVDRIPVWAMASTDAPVRFDGQGFFALGPDAPNPFGIAPGQGETRALVALFARGAGQEGSIGIVPLKVGPTRIDLRLVAYLRACGETVVLDQRLVEIDPATANPAVVLTDDAGARAYTHAVELPKHDRRIEFNETRFRVLTGAGTEVLARSGRGLSVSPTGRFAVVEVGDDIGGAASLEVVDISDGRTVASMPSFIVGWALGDSFVVATEAPYAKVHLEDLYADTVDIDDLATGPSCCLAFQQEGYSGTSINIDLENAIVSAWGMFGHSIVPLMAPRHRSEFSVGAAHPGGGDGTAALTRVAMESFGPVAPVSLTDGALGVPGGLQTTMIGDEGALSEESQWIGLNPVGRSIVRLKRAGHAVLAIDAPAIMVSEDLSSDIGANVSRIGLRSLPTLNGETLVPFMTAGYEGYSQDELDARNAEFHSVIDSVIHRAAESGYHFQKTQNEYDFQRECDHFALNDPGSIPFPSDLDGIQVVGSEDEPIYIMRFSCVGGATGGSLRGVSHFMILDTSRRHTGAELAEDVVADSYGFYLANRERRFYEADFRTKLYDRLLVTYAPDDGAISAFDLDARTFVLVAQDTPNGDLLQDVFLTEDRGHLVQSNADGSLFVHRLRDGAVVLSGRVVDGEVAVWTDDFRFDATAEAASVIDLRFPGLDAQFSLDRFETTRRVDGLAPAIMSGDAQPVGPVSVPPALTANAVAEDDAVRVEAAFDLRRPAALLEVYQDGVLTDTLPVDGTAIAKTVPRLRGARWVALVARGAAGTASREVAIDLGSDRRGQGRITGLLVGVDVYEDPRLADLNYAKADVARMEETLLSALVGAEPPRLLTKSAATPEAILQAVRDMVTNLAPEDHGVLFFAGHGLRGPNGAFYFGTPETDLDDLPGTALPWRAVAELLAASPARVTVLLDACHAGAANSGAFATNDDAVAGLSAIPANITILAASKGRELSTEAAQAGGGLFTAAVADVLTGDRARHDANGNGRIETSEFYRGVKDWVLSQPGAAQTPWMTRTRMVGEYALF